jgi:hypothetical protein
MLMTTHDIPTANQKKVKQLQKAVDDLLAESLHRGFFGTLSVEVTVNDGTIQHIRRKVEQIEK